MTVKELLEKIGKKDPLASATDFTSLPLKKIKAIRAQVDTEIRMFPDDSVLTETAQNQKTLILSAGYPGRNHFEKDGGNNEYYDFGTRSTDKERSLSVVTVSDVKEFGNMIQDSDNAVCSRQDGNFYCTKEVVEGVSGSLQRMSGGPSFMIQETEESIVINYIGVNSGRRGIVSILARQNGLQNIAQLRI